MLLEQKSKQLKEIIGRYDTQWLLGNLSGLIHAAGAGMADDEVGALSSPMRQLYYLAGLLVTSDPTGADEINYPMAIWHHIVALLNEIEAEYDKLFFPNTKDDVTEDWKRIRKVAMPSFLSYFNQGPLNYEEQTISWVNDLFSQLDAVIEKATGAKTSEFITFYNTLDSLHHANFRGHMDPRAPVRPDWKKYVKYEVKNTAPPALNLYSSDKDIAMFQFMADPGVVDRFFPEELVSDKLPLEKVKAILSLLSTTRTQGDFLYYTSTKPANPLYERPIVDLGNDLYQVFEVKQVIHAIERQLEKACTQVKESIPKYVEKKGKLLEMRIIKLFKDFFGPEARIFHGYFVDGCEQDLLVLWKKIAFIIEGKGFGMREPLRDPDKAFERIKDDFKRSIGYGYEQTCRVEDKFLEEVPLRITDDKGNLIEEIDTTEFEYDFSIIVNLVSFGQIQIDLSSLLERAHPGDLFPWAIRFDDLETFLLTMKAKKMPPLELVKYLLLREKLHGKLICLDELEICGAFLSKKLTLKMAAEADVLAMTPDLGNIFDEQYNKGMGFENEKLLAEKKSGKWMFI